MNHGDTAGQTQVSQKQMEIRGLQLWELYYSLAKNRVGFYFEMCETVLRRNDKVAAS